MPRRAGLLGLLLAVPLVGFVSSGAAKTAVRHCNASDVSLRRGVQQSALAHYRQVIRVRNVSTTACRMSGWFTVTLLGPHGGTLRSHERRITSDMFGRSSKLSVILKPRHRGSFAIDTTAPATSCPYSAAIAVVPPGGHGSARLKVKLLACATFSVLPVQPDDKAVA